MTQTKEDGEANITMFKLTSADVITLSELYSFKEPFYSGTKFHNSWVVNFVGDKYYCLMDKSRRYIEDMDFKLVPLSEDASALAIGDIDANHYPTMSEQGSLENWMYLGSTTDGSQFAIMDSNDDSQIVVVYDTISKKMVRKCSTK